MINKTELGNRIRERRKALNLSQQQLADQAGLKCSTLAGIERADNGMPNADAFMILARELNVTPEWLATGNGSEIESDALENWGTRIQEAMGVIQLNPVQVAKLMHAIRHFEGQGIQVSDETLIMVYNTYLR